jgi:hypothetical protein
LAGKCGFVGSLWAKYIKNADFNPLQAQQIICLLHKSAIFCTFTVFVGFGGCNAECGMQNAEFRAEV